MTDKFGIPHRAAMLALASAGRAISNTELEAIVGFRIDGKVRYLLNDEKYVTSERQGNRPFVHALTAKGWAWCVDELFAGRPDRAQHLGGTLYAFLGAFGQFLKGESWQLVDEFRARAVEFKIRDAYHKLAMKPRDWVRLADLRPLLNGASRSDVDSALKELSRDGRAHLAPDSNRKDLTDADHAAAIRLGGEDKHLLVIEES